MPERMVSAEAVVSALTGGAVVYEDTRTFDVLKRLRLLDMLPPWYILEVKTEDGWETMDDDLEDLADAQRTLKMRQEEDAEPEIPGLAPRHRSETPQQYAERVQRWVKECESPPVPPVRQYRIREYRYGKRPRTVQVEKDRSSP